MFFDLECPYCAQFHQAVFTEIWSNQSDKIGFSFVHFPLDRHRFARPAAHAAECAAEQGRFLPFIDRIYSGRDSLGLKSWWGWAQEAQVPDSIGFHECLNGDLPSRIMAGARWAETLQARGTPSIILNGWQLPTPPSAAELRRMMEVVRLGDPTLAEFLGEG